MMKGNNGFTLIELLAVIVIIGILSVYSVPRVIGLFSRSRSKMYVSDALKFTSMVEQMVTSSKIDKPDNGSSIIVCLNYLDTSDLDSPPNQGKYLDNSFVVVKNNNGVLEYSVMLVENMKNGGYKGIDLTKSDKLQDDKAINLVKTFSESEIDKLNNCFNKDSNSDIIKYINEKISISNYIDETSLLQIYNTN